MPVRAALAYLSLLAAALVGFFAIRSLGEHWFGSTHALVAPSTATDATTHAAPAPDAFLHVLLLLATVIVVARLLGALCRKLGQPPVIGEVAAGILLGPSFLARIAPAASAFLLPASLAPTIGVISQVGIILYLFVVGLELDIDLMRGRAHASLLTSHASIAAPFLLGMLLAVWLFPRFAPPSVSFGVFSLFIGVSMSITAFPVLARILTDGGLIRTPLGAIALACASIDDVTAWLLLAVTVATAQADSGSALSAVGLTIAFIAAMMGIVRPAIGRMVARADAAEISQGTLALVCAALLVCALATEAIGIHALFGAFLLGVAIPAKSKLAHALRGKLEDVVIVLFLPAFFAFTGMRTELGLVVGAEPWLATALIIAVASIGKLGATAVTARLSGLGWNTALALGSLLNTRGLMELVVLNIGLNLGAISPQLFTMFVLMALVTTAATAPLLRLLRVDGSVVFSRNVVATAPGLPEAQAVRPP